MNVSIEKELKKILNVATTLRNDGLKNNVNFLLTADDDKKVSFINNKNNYSDKENKLSVIVDMSIFDNSEKVKIAIGKNSKAIADSCKGFLNDDSRRFVNVVVADAKSFYEKDLKAAKKLEKEDAISYNNNRVR